jgi:N-acetylglucosamine kinase-like BadF-type ATPase
MVSALYVGVDGGGTHSRAVVVDAAGRVRARRSAGEALVRGDDPGAVVAALSRLVLASLRDAGGTLPATALCCALAGAGRTPERDRVARDLASTGIAHRVRVITDAEAALHDAFGTGPGILLIAGTGSIAWARAADGRVARVGGWGDRLGDEGSAFAIALAGLRAVARAHDGRARETLLATAALRHTGAPAPEDLIRWAAAASKAEIAAFAPAVIARADTGDETAAAIITHAVAQLALHVATARKRLAPWTTPPRLATAGALIAPPRGPLLERLRAALAELGESVELASKPVDAASGAAAIARGEASTNEAASS